MIPDTPSSAASGMGENELASASVRPEPGSVETMAPLVNELRALADCDSRAGEPLGKCMRRAADKIERLAEHVDYIEAQWLAKAAALSAKDRELAETRAFARKLSDALLKVRPLGGSEMFTRVGEVFYADPAYCGGEIDRLRAELHAAKAENIKIKQEKFATTRARDEAMAALREKEEALSKAQRTIGHRDRRIARLWAAIEDARAKGYRLPVEEEPPVVLSSAEGPCPHAPTYDAGLCCGHPDDCTFIAPVSREQRGEEA